MTHKNIRIQTLVTARTLWILLFILPVSFIAAAQQQNDSGTTAPKPADSTFYRSTIKKAAATTTAYQYRTPDNELMRWPHYPETPDAVQRRLQRQATARKPGNVVAKDVVTGVLKKKKPVAVRPEF